MDVLYTRSGRLLQRSGNHVYSRSGSYLGQLKGGKVFDPSGCYCGTIVGDRVVYRTIDSAMKVPASIMEACSATSHPNRTGSSIWGTEPPFRD
jgi:hypothetical protein